MDVKFILHLFGRKIKSKCFIGENFLLISNVRKTFGEKSSFYPPPIELILSSSFGVDDRTTGLLDIILFADDTNLFFSHKDQNYLVETIDSEMHKLIEWFMCNKFSLNQ